MITLRVFTLKLIYSLKKKKKETGSFFTRCNQRNKAILHSLNKRISLKSLLYYLGYFNNPLFLSIF